LSYLSLEDVQSYIEPALNLGVKKFSFTGGEPFLNPHFLDILKLAASHLPCSILSNGTAPLRKKWQALLSSGIDPQQLHFRISLDAPEAEVHDLERGRGNFDLALKTMRDIESEGFGLSVAAQWPKGADAEVLKAKYQALFLDRGLLNSVNVVLFPDFLPPGVQADVPEITEDCMTRYHDEASRSQFMCAFSRMVIKRGDNTQVSACTLVDDDEAYDLSPDLKESVGKQVKLGHHRCFSCFSLGASCSEY
jgi:pyruvate-formate lyase-activating enzyme